MKVAPVWRNELGLATCDIASPADVTLTFPFPCCRRTDIPFHLTCFLCSDNNDDTTSHAHQKSTSCTLYGGSRGRTESVPSTKASQASRTSQAVQPADMFHSTDFCHRMIQEGHYITHQKARNILPAELTRRVAFTAGQGINNYGRRMYTTELCTGESKL